MAGLPKRYKIGRPSSGSPGLDVGMKFNGASVILWETRIETTCFPAISIQILLDQASLYWRHYRLVRWRWGHFFHQNHFSSSAKEKSAVRLLKTSKPPVKNSTATGQ